MLLPMTTLRCTRLLLIATDCYIDIMLRRVDDTQGTWQMPQVCNACLLSLLAAGCHAKYACMHIQGGIDALENPFAAATRELLEETGISSVTFLAQVSTAIELLV